MDLNSTACWVFGGMGFWVLISCSHPCLIEMLYSYLKQLLNKNYVKRVDLDMFEEFEERGEWWLPDNPDKKVFGTLKFNPNSGAVLDLISSFIDIQSERQPALYTLILGKVSTGKIITLYQCSYFRSSLNISISSGFGTCQFYVYKVFTGFHFQEESDIKFKSLIVYYSYLNEWSQMGLPNIELSQEEFSIKYKRRELIEPVNIKQDWQVFMELYADYDWDKLDININKQVNIVIESDEEKSLQEYEKVMRHIQNFLSLCVTKPVYPLFIRGLKMGDAFSSITGLMEYRPISVNILYQVSNTPIVTKNLMPYDMLLTFSKLSSKFEYYLGNWFRKIELLEPIYELYFGTIYNSYMYPQQEFLNLMQSVEAYHRKNPTMKQYEISQEEHSERVEKIINKTPEEYKTWLKNRLVPQGKVYISNQLDLRKRLVEIINVCSEALGEFIEQSNLFKSRKMRDSFIYKIVRMRNYLTHLDDHGDESLKQQAANDNLLRYWSQKIKLIIEICFLYEVGFSPEEIKDIFMQRNDKELIIHLLSTNF
ncbi:HEPN domain-containing protein [Anabaena sp. UHCC 0451]|uniref:ApeA N-terminal domain 1-containing protein n=1 Tax=Anabaena sp. UHCC 0451 TaxID=2055235 RepID=UPI002B21AE2C|nr:HEPN domain-containing protein [Anabaena sp. UHCC 0451]MEA5576763.1 HEPN domain-containing protein [Anabaena sp. UHCC 0451]